MSEGESSEVGVDVPLPAAFAMRFSPSNQLIAIVRRFVMAFYGRVLGDNELSAHLGLATHELLENAVKYGTDDEAELRVDVRDAAPEMLIEVVLRNRARPEHIAEAVQLVRSIGEADDPFTLYQQLMLDAVNRGHGSKLGLARIRAESGMTLDIKDDGGVLEISALMRYRPGRSQ